MGFTRTHYLSESSLLLALLFYHLVICCKYSTHFQEDGVVLLYLAQPESEIMPFRSRTLLRGLLMIIRNWWSEKFGNYGQTLPGYWSAEMINRRQIARLLPLIFEYLTSWDKITDYRIWNSAKERNGATFCRGALANLPMGSPKLLKLLQSCRGWQFNSDRWAGARHKIGDGSPSAIKCNSSWIFEFSIYKHDKNKRKVRKIILKNPKSWTDS